MCRGSAHRHAFVHRTWATLRSKDSVDRPSRTVRWMMCSTVLIALRNMGLLPTRRIFGKSTSDTTSPFSKILAQRPYCQCWHHRETTRSSRLVWMPRRFTVNGSKCRAEFCLLAQYRKACLQQEYWIQLQDKADVTIAKCILSHFTAFERST